jgi:serine/threonine protein kinase
MAETEQALSTRTWDRAASPRAGGWVRAFESAWKSSRRGGRPEPRDFLPTEPDERPPALLAILRAEIGLRWEGGERATVERYRERYPDLGPDDLVALAYEEFCLREEAGDAPVPAEYDERFPDLAPRLRRVFDIHELVGSGGSAAFRATATPEVAFPESGQTIAGFHLRDELGRGAFARVFLAEERQLADRPVALKVSRNGSREPQTLARLQHTHIVPVHSTRVDPATGLHLLCMPYFGRVTLDRLLAEPGAKTAATGADVLAALDRLEPAPAPDVPAARSTFARLPYARALAWWGARMAEALAHAHERGVLHRDIKPSNVLVTADGLPMLLDFNLARDPRADAAGPSLGGTVAYMAPEHLDALAEGDDARVDGRADVFALGVLLFEALTGRRPFPAPVGASSVAEALRHAAEARRCASPAIRETHPEVPAALEAVVLKCLAVHPAARYESASALAADLQAGAEDDPLRHAREPFASRALRWSRRHRWPILLAVLVGLTWALFAHALLRARDDQRAMIGTLRHRIEGARKLVASGRLERAMGQFEDVADRIRTIPGGETQPPLTALLRTTESGFQDAKARIEASRLADALAESVDRALARPPDAKGTDREDLRAFGYTVAPFFAQGTAPGAVVETESMSRLDPARRARVRGDSETLLFARALFQARSDRRDVSKIVGLGLAMGGDRSPWEALGDWVADPSMLVEAPAAGEGRSSRTSLLLGLLAEAQGRPAEALAWLRRADRLGPSRPGLSAAIARLCIAAGKLDDARAFAQKAAESSRTQQAP